MKEAGVDFITLCIDQNGALTLEQELNRQGMAEIPVLLPQGYGDTEFVEANAELLEGDVLSLFSRPFEANQEGTLVPEMIEWIDAGGYKMNDQAIQGWINADMAVVGSPRRRSPIRPRQRDPGDQRHHGLRRIGSGSDHRLDQAAHSLHR